MFGFDAPKSPSLHFNRACRKALATGIVVFLACIGCRRESQKPPAAVYSAIEKEFLSGELSRARQQSEEAYQRFDLSRPDWAVRFRLELAKVLIYQGQSHDSLVLLEQPLPAHSPIESEVRRENFLALAQVSLGHFDEAERTVLEAERQCPNNVIRAEVLGTRGLIYIKEGKLDDAE